MRAAAQKLSIYCLPWLPSALLTVVLYGGSLSYGFMFDDPVDLPRASGRSYLSILTSAGESAYYRPLILLMWKALYDLLGRNDGAVLHGLVLAVHVINGCLVYAIGKRLNGIAAGLLASLLFVTFPLSYQAVANVNAFFHPLVTTFLLAAVLLYWRWRETRAMRWLALAILSGVLAVFTHEYGVVLVGLVVLSEAFAAIQSGERRVSPAPLLFLGLSVAFTLTWLVVPRWQHEWSFDPSSLQLNALYFFQGPIFPVAGQLAPWRDGLGLTDSEILLLIGLPALLLIAAVQAIARRALSMTFAIIWMIGSIAPAAISLSFAYIIDGPRLFYLSSVGIALLWGGFLSIPFSSPRRLIRLAGSLLTIALAVLIALQSALFIQERNVIFAEGAKVVRLLSEKARDPLRPARTFVNFPSWFAPRQSDYALGHTGVIMVPYYIGLGRVAYIHNGDQPDIASVGYDVIAKPWDHHYGAHGENVGIDDLETTFRRGGGVYATRFYSNTLDIEYVGAILQEQPSGGKSEAYLADFGGWARLVDAKVEPQQDAIDLTLTWRSLAPNLQDYTIFAHLYDSTGKVIAQADGYTIGEMFPARKWRPGDMIEDRRRIVWPEIDATGNYRILVGLYDRNSGERAPAHDQAAKRILNDAAVVGEIDGSKL